MTVLVTRMTERLACAVVRRVGFDAQLAKCVSAATLDRMIGCVAHASCDRIAK